jgi:hypothetical protein
VQAIAALKHCVNSSKSLYMLGCDRRAHAIIELARAVSQHILPLQSALVRNREQFMKLLQDDIDSRTSEAREGEPLVSLSSFTRLVSKCLKENDSGKSWNI